MVGGIVTGLRIFNGAGGDVRGTGAPLPAEAATPVPA
jgi:hypothetical protein